MADMVGQLVGDYRIVAHLGQGGMAEVYKAFDPDNGRFVAIKALHRHLANEPEFVQRFEREATVAAKLSHPHIVPVFDFGHDNDTHYMVMELVNGPSLKAEILARKEQNQPFSLAEVGRIMVAIAAGIQHAHERGMIHRDLKPANLIFTEAGSLLILDFGIARILGDTQYTVTGALIGSPHYMSPEQGRGGRATAASDVYALGIVLYEMLTGALPFVGETPISTIMMHINQPLPLPTEIRADIPRSMEWVLLKALSKSPSDRFQSCADMAAAVAKACGLATNERLLTHPVRTVAKAREVKELAPTDPIFLAETAVSITCPTCQTVNEGGTQFCSKCGKMLILGCPFCYASNPVGSVACHKCGKNLRRVQYEREQAQQRQRNEELQAIRQADRLARLKRLLRELEDPQRHSLALYSLQQMGQTAVPALIKLIQHRPAPTTARYGGIKALAMIGHPAAIAPLTAVLQDPDATIRFWAIDALETMDVKTAVSALTPLLKDPNKRIRARTTQALETFNTPAAQAALKQNKRWWQR